MIDLRKRIIRAGTSTSTWNAERVKLNTMLASSTVMSTASATIPPSSLTSAITSGISRRPPRMRPTR